MQYETICLYCREDLCVVSILFIISTTSDDTKHLLIACGFLFIYIRPTSLSPKWFWKLNNTQRSVNLKVNALLQQFYMGKCHGNNFTSEMVASLNWLVFYFEKLFLFIELASLYLGYRFHHDSICCVYPLSIGRDGIFLKSWGKLKPCLLLVPYNLSLVTKQKHFMGKM